LLRCGSKSVGLREGGCSRAALVADYVSLRPVEERARGARHLHFVEGVDAEERLFRSRHSLQGERPGSGVTELGWGNGRKSITRDTELAVEQLCGHVRHALSPQ
jgi:hypothetical protein